MKAHPFIQCTLSCVFFITVATDSFAQNDDKRENEIPTGAISGAAWRKDPENQQRYWIIKDAFRKAGERWNRENAGKSPRVLVPSGVVAEFRRAYIDALDELWPTLTQERGYTPQKIAEIKGRFSNSDLIDLTVRVYLDETVTAMDSTDTAGTDKQDSRSVFARMNIPTLGVRDAPHAVTIPDGHHLGRATIVTTPNRCTVHLTGPRLDEKFQFETGSYTLPLIVGKYVAEVSALGRTTLKRDFEVTSGGDTKVEVTLSEAAYPAADRPKSTAKLECFREDEARRVEALLSLYDSTSEPDSLLRYDFRRFYAPWQEGRFDLGKERGLTQEEFNQRWTERYQDLPTLSTLVPHRTRGEFNDGTGQQPNKAFHDPCLNVKIDYSALDGDRVHAGIDRIAFENDVAHAIVEWANARRADAPDQFDPLTCFSVNDRFYVKAHVRLFADGKVNPLLRGDTPFVRLGDGSRGFVVNNYVRWERSRYDEASTRFPLVWKCGDGDEDVKFPPLRRSDNNVDLVIAFTKKPRLCGDDVNVIATTETGKNIELHVNTKANKYGSRRWAFVPQKAWASYRNPQGPGVDVQSVRFDCVIVHELGHYFGTPHLPRVNDDDFAGCVMWSTYKEKEAALMIPDVLAFNCIVYLGKARLGTRCEGLRFGPALGSK
jgi:hypothetical protein